MAVRISELPAAPAATPHDVVPMTDTEGQVTYKASVGQLRGYQAVEKLTDPAVHTLLQAFVLSVVDSAAAVTLDLPEATPAGGWVDVLCVGDGVVTVDAGADGLNTMGTATLDLHRGDMVRFTRSSDTAPAWSAPALAGETAQPGRIIIGDGSDPSQWIGQDFLEALYAEGSGAATGSIDTAADHILALDADQQRLIKVPAAELRTSVGAFTADFPELADGTTVLVLEAPYDLTLTSLAYAFGTNVQASVAVTVADVEQYASGSALSGTGTVALGDIGVATGAKTALTIAGTSGSDSATFQLSFTRG